MSCDDRKAGRCIGAALDENHRARCRGPREGQGRSEPQCRAPLVVLAGPLLAARRAALAKPELSQNEITWHPQLQQTLFFECCGKFAHARHEHQNCQIQAPAQ